MHNNKPLYLSHSPSTSYTANETTTSTPTNAATTVRNDGRYKVAAPYSAKSQHLPLLFSLSKPGEILKLTTLYGKVPQLPSPSLQHAHPYHGSKPSSLFGSRSVQFAPP